MKKLNGWYRLWISLSIPWLLSISIILWVDFDTSRLVTKWDLSHSNQKFYEKRDPEDHSKPSYDLPLYDSSKSEILMTIEFPILSESGIASVKEKVQRMVVEEELPVNDSQITDFVAEVVKMNSLAISAKEEYEQLFSEELKQQLIKYALKWFVFACLPPISLLLVAYTVIWIKNGFKGS